MQLKYLMIDHGGVLDGIYSSQEAINSRNDLILGDEVYRTYNVLKDGIKIVEKLNELVDTYNYKIVFHTVRTEENHLMILERLKSGCAKAGLQFPKVTAMAVGNEKIFNDVTPNSPTIIKNKQHGIHIAAYDSELYGKEKLRVALSQLLNIKPEETGNHVVIDDNHGIIQQAKDEGYKTYEIENGLNNGIPLTQALDEVLNHELKQKNSSSDHSNSSIGHENNTSSNYQSFRF